MEPAVPFALLGVVELVAVAGWLVLAGTALFPALRRPLTPLFVVGVLALAVADAFTAVRFGQASSRLTAELHLGGFALLAAACAAGVPQPRRRRTPASASRVSPPASPPAGPGAVASMLPLPLPLSLPLAAGVVVPLGAPHQLALIGGVLGTIAGGAALARGRFGDGPGSSGRGDGLLAALLGGCLLLAAGASFAAVDAGSSRTAALVELGLRAASALAALGVPVALARSSVLAKVVSAILAGVVVMAAGAVGVVGTSVADSVTGQQGDATAQAAQGQATAVQSVETQAAQNAELVVGCQLSEPTACPALLRSFATLPGYFAAVVPRGGPARLVAGNGVGPLALRELGVEPAVTQALAGGTAASTLVVLNTRPAAVTALGVATSAPRAPGHRQLPAFVAVYGVRYTDAALTAVAGQISYGVSLLADGQILASSLSPPARAAVLRTAAAAGVLGAQLAPGRGVTSLGQAGLPTVSFQPLAAGDNDSVQVATLAVSLPGDRVVGAERSVLNRLFVTAVAVLLLAALFAVLLGRRIVDPVRRLTVAAGRVRRGDLEASTALASRDEVGVLSRAFDSMTTALRSMTGDLRAAADSEAALRARLQTVVDSMGEGLVAVDKDGAVTGLNRAAAALLGVSEADANGRPLAGVVDVRGQSGAPLFGRGSPPVLEADGDLVTPVAPSGTVPVHVGVAALLGSGDRPGAVIVLRDTSRDREVERMKTEFLSNVSHELRTPLTPIRGYTELLLRRGQVSADTAAEFVAAIHASTIRMQRVVELLVDVAALEAGRVEPAPRAVRVEAFVVDCVGRWRTRWPERADDLRRRIGDGLPDVEIDPVWVSKALDELVDNAVKYTPPGTAITIAASDLEEPGWVRVVVHDSGQGVPADALPGMLADFSQADSSETRRIGGLGLGLSFVRRLGEAFGLRFVAGGTQGGGAVFGLDLPVAPADGSGEAEAAPSGAAVARGPRLPARGTEAYSAGTTRGGAAR